MQRPWDVERAGQGPIEDPVGLVPVRGQDRGQAVDDCADVVPRDASNERGGLWRSRCESGQLSRQVDGHGCGPASGHLSQRLVVEAFCLVLVQGKAA